MLTTSAENDRAGPGARKRHVLAAAADGLATFISTRGGRPQKVMESVAVPQETLGDPLGSLDLSAYCKLMECAAGETGDPHFGLHFGNDFHPQRLGLIGELAMSSPTIGSALFNLARFFPYHQQVTETRFRQWGRMVSLEYRILDGGIVQRRQDADLTLGMFRNIVRAGMGARWCPQQVHVEHPPLGGTCEHERVFGAPVYFAQRTNAIVCHDLDLERPMPRSDPERMAQLREQLVRLAGGTGSLPLLDRVRGEIRSCLNADGPDIETVAASMGIARWTLQRRLAADGATFSALVNDVRRSLAMQYLREPYLPISDVATLLGYAEASVFTRSCIRWFGCTPTRLRQERVAPTH